LHSQSSHQRCNWLYLAYSVFLFTFKTPHRIISYSTPHRQSSPETATTEQKGKSPREQCRIGTHIERLSFRVHHPQMCKYCSRLMPAAHALYSGVCSFCLWTSLSLTQFLLACSVLSPATSQGECALFSLSFFVLWISSQ
jgi:hypothetical protein